MSANINVPSSSVIRFEEHAQAHTIPAGALIAHIIEYDEICPKVLPNTVMFCNEKPELVVLKKTKYLVAILADENKLHELLKTSNRKTLKFSGLKQILLTLGNGWKKYAVRSKIPANNF